MSAHTPGPWVVDWYDDYNDDGDPLPPTHAAAIRGGNVTVCGTCDGCNKIAEANAHLIAAAPEMLAALEAVEQKLKMAPGVGVRAVVRAVIAKARGGK